MFVKCYMETMLIIIEIVIKNTIYWWFLGEKVLFYSKNAKNCRKNVIFSVYCHHGQLNV